MVERRIKMKVRLIHCIIPEVGAHGDVVEMAEEQAQYYIELGKAEALEVIAEEEETAPETAPAAPKEKTKTEKKGRGRPRR